VHPTRFVWHQPNPRDNKQRTPQLDLQQQQQQQQQKGGQRDSLQRLAPDGFTFAALARLGDLPKRPDNDQSGESVQSPTSYSSVTTVTTDSGAATPPAPPPPSRMSLISVPRLWRRCKQSFLYRQQSSNRHVPARGGSQLPAPLLRVFVGVLGRSSDAGPELAAEAFAMLAEAVATSSPSKLTTSVTDCNSLIGALAGPSPEADAEAKSTHSLNKLLRIFALSLQSREASSLSSTSASLLLLDNAWDGLASTLEAALVPPSSLGVGLSPALSSGFEAALRVFLTMGSSSKMSSAGVSWPSPDTQTYITLLSVLTARTNDANYPGCSLDEAREAKSLCALVAASLLSDAIQTLPVLQQVVNGDGDGGKVVLGQPQQQQVGALLNAALRASDGDTARALHMWRTQVLPVLAKVLSSSSSSPSPQSTTVLLGAAFHGLIHCVGVAGRPDLALQAVYAMKKSGACEIVVRNELEADEDSDGAKKTTTSESNGNGAVAWNVYRAAVQKRQKGLELKQRNDKSLRESTAVSANAAAASARPSVTSLSSRPLALTPVPPVPPVSILAAPLLRSGHYDTQLELECLGGFAYAANREAAANGGNDSNDNNVNGPAGDLRDKLPFTKIRIRF